MIAISAIILLVASVAVAETGNAADPYGLLGTDPNSLSCDPKGQIFLLLPHDTECNKYYTCAHGKEVEMICPVPLIFSFVLQVCNWDWATKCILRNPEDVDGSGDYDEGTDEWAVEDTDVGVRPAQKPQNGHGMENIPDSPLAESPVMPLGPLSQNGVAHFKAPIDCKNSKKAAQRIANKDDCQRYWRCVDGEVNSFFCTDGLFFNEKTQQCDFEANVVCNVNHEHELKGEFMVYSS